MAFRRVNHQKPTKKIMLTTELWVTSVILAVASATVGLMAWLEKQPKTKLKPRHFPTTLVMIIAFLVALLAGFHVANLVKPIAGP
jgi:hypothetical protein